VITIYIIKKALPFQNSKNLRRWNFAASSYWKRPGHWYRISWGAGRHHFNGHRSLQLDLCGGHCRVAPDRNRARCAGDTGISSTEKEIGADGFCQVIGI